MTSTFFPTKLPKWSLFKSLFFLPFFIPSFLASLFLLPIFHSFFLFSSHSLLSFFSFLPYPPCLPVFLPSFLHFFIPGISTFHSSLLSLLPFFFSCLPSISASLPFLPSFPPFFLPFPSFRPPLRPSSFPRFSRNNNLTFETTF